jgi:cell division protein FtsW (lipid II flippase)
MAQRLKTDWILFLAVLTMVCFGLVMVYSASSSIAQLKFHWDSTHFFVRQLGWAVVSFLMLLYCMKRDYRTLECAEIRVYGVGRGGFASAGGLRDG